jgi:hypothetical protein
MDVRAVVVYIAVFSTGLIAGILLGDRMGNSFARPKLSAAAFMAFQREQNRRFAAMMPLPILAAVVASAAWLVLIRSQAATPGFGLAAAGTLALVLAIAITRIVNIPINDRIDRWGSAPFAEAQGLWSRWERAHTVRTVFAVLAFLCELGALAVSRDATP